MLLPSKHMHHLYHHHIILFFTAWPRPFTSLSEIKCCNINHHFLYIYILPLHIL